MSLGLFAIEDALVAQLEQHVTAIEVYDGDPAKSLKLTGGVWLHESTDDIDWRGLGGQPWNREETIRIELRAWAYREAHEQGAARRDARSVLRTAIEQIEAAIAADQSLGTTCTDARLGRVKPRTAPVDRGWTAEAELIVICKHIPTPGTP